MIHLSGIHFVFIKVISLNSLMRFYFSKGGVKVQRTYCLRRRGGRFGNCLANPSAYISKISHLLASKTEEKCLLSNSPGVWVLEGQMGANTYHTLKVQELG